MAYGETNFGWSLPPGVTTLPGEEPNPCEYCWNIDEDSEKCPAGDQTSKDFNFDMCPVHSMVDKCSNCDKKMMALLGYLPKSYIVGNPWSGAVGCCSEKCAQELNAKYEKEIESMRLGDEQAAEAYEKALENYEGSPEEWNFMYNNGMVEKKEYNKMMRKFKKEDRSFKRRRWLGNVKKKLTRQPCLRCNRELNVTMYHGRGGCPFKEADSKKGRKNTW